MILEILFLISQLSFAVGEKELLMGLKESGESKDWRNATIETNTEPKKAIIRTYSHGNLPPRLIRKDTLGLASSQDPIQFPELAKMNKSGIDVGDIFDCEISQDIKAYVGSISPIVAKVINGPQKGLLFVGNATMDPKTKDIVIEFNKMRDLSESTKHSVKATIHDSNVQIGLQGTLHSKYWQYFFATVLSRSAEGYAQASVQRDRNIFGSYQEVPSAENAGKVAVTQAAASTADIIADGLKNLPEFVTRKGPMITKVFVIETPTLTN